MADTKSKALARAYATDIVPEIKDKTPKKQKNFKRLNKIMSNKKLLNEEMNRSKTWFNRKMRNLKDPKSRQRSFQAYMKERKKMRPEIGRMYFFPYQAKGDGELEFWDQYPLIFPLDMSGKHILGINLHLAPPPYRAVILDALLEHYTLGDFRYDIDDYDVTIENVDYGLIRSMSQSRLIKPIVRKYLKSNVLGPFIEIPANEWTHTVMLPLHKIKGGARKAYSSYRKSI